MHAKLAASSTTWTTGLAPLGHISWPKFQPFSVDSGAFSIVGRIRDESAVGSHGEIYRGWGARNGREKAGSWTGGRSSSQKGVQHEDFPGGHPSYGATGGTSNLPGGVTLRTGGATPRAAYAREARRELHDVDNWACPVGPHFVAQISPFSVDSGAFSIVGRIRDESAVGSHGEIYRGWGARNGREKAGSWTGGRSSSQKGVQHEDFPGGHPSYGATGGTSNLPGGVTLRTGGATPRAAYAREARRELHDVDNWACPVGPHFVAQISPFSVDSGAFSIVGRIRDESAVGSHGEIYRGWGARNGREKAGSWTGGRSSSQKGVQHEDFPGGHPSYGATGGTSNLPGGVTLRTGGATPRAAYAREARRELHDVDNWACPVGPHFVAQISPFSVDSGAFSIVGRIRDESAVGSHGEIYRGWGARNGREKAGSWTGGRSSSQKGVQHEDFPGGHPSYGATGGTSNLPGGVTLRTGGATPRAAYAREARRELHDVDNWACPVGPHFVAQISPFSVDSGAFSIVGRIRDESAVGSHGEIYRGWGARNGREKAGSWTGGRSSSQKGVQHEDFPGGHPSYGATGGTSNLPGGVTLRTGGATPRAAYAREARRELHDVDNWACPVGPHFVAQISPFSVDSGAFSIVGRIRDESAVGSHGEIYRGWGARNGREKAGSWTGGRSSSQKGVQHEDFPGGHPSYGATGGTSNLPGGVTLRTGGATPRAAYAREARRELHDVDNWACPVGPHFVAQISPFSVDSGAFSIVGRIRDESAVGSHGEIYRGWGARNGREKAGKLDGGATGGTSNLPGGVTLRTGGATPRAAYAREARRELHDVDNWACPVGPHFVAQISPFSVDSGAFSIVGRIRDESAVGSHGEIYRGWGARNGREKAGSWTGGRSSSQKGVQHEDFPGGHPSYGATGGTSNLPGGVTLRTGGATPRAAYAREARRELHDVDNWACPVGPHFVAQISPFSVDSGAFSIVGRIRDESAVGSHGEIYRGWGARNGREKAGSWTGGRSSSQKGVQHEDFPGGHPSYGATGGTSNLPGGVTLRTGGATPRAAYAREARRELHDVDNWACPVGPHFVAQISPFSVDSGAFSIVGRIRDESAVGSHGEIYRGWGARNGREKAGSWTGGRSSSQKGVQHEDFPGGHPSYGATGGTSNLPGGVTLRTGGATPRAAYAREARRELHDVDNWACPVGPHFVAQISPFSVDSGAFSIVGRIRDESAVGSHGEIYRGWGARNGREKAGSWTGGRSSSQKGVQHEDFPGGHPSYGATGGTSNLPGGVTLRTGGATPRAAYAREARRELHDVDNWACPVGPHFVAQISPFSVDSGAFSIVGRIRDESAVGSHGEIYRGWGARNGREKAGSWTGGRSSSQKGVQHEDFPGGHPSYGATGGTSNLPGGVTLRTGGATPRAAYAREARRELHDVDNWACPVGPHFVAQISPFSVDSGAFSIVGRIRDESAVGSHGEIYRGWGARNGREKAGSWTGGRSSSQKGVQHEDFPGGHPSYGATGGTSNLPGGVTLRTGGATPRAAYAREARRELHDVDNWACPVGPHFVAQISPFSVDSGAFSIVGRIRDESAVGSHGEIYRGWGARNGREKAGSWTGGRSSSQKGVQHEDFPGGHPSYGATGGTSNLPGGVTLRTGGATPRAAYAREARRELHDVDNWACPVGPHFVAQISPFSVDSGAFSIVGRIRDESAVGSHGEIYRGWGARNGREKAGKLDGGATGGTSNLPGGVTLRTGGATPRAAYAREARRELHDVDNWACPVGPHFVAQISPFSVDSGAFSIVGRIRDESAVGSHGEIYRGWGARNGREKAGSWTGGRSSSQKGVQHEDFPGGHPSYGATGGTSNLPGGVTLRTGGATPRAAYAREARRELHDVDNWACPVGPHFVAQISPFSVDSGAFSIVGRIRDESAVGSHGEIYRGWGARNGREKAGSWTGGRSSSQKGVQHEDFPGGHPSYGATGGTSNLPGGVTLRTGGATPRAAYAREARRELHDVDNWACPVGPHFVAQISPFSVDSGAFSIVGRIRDESAVGSHGEIYRGWGARNGREKAGSWTGGRSSSQKGVQHEDFPGGHPSYGATGGTSNLPGGVTLRTGGATPRAAYAREARRELHDVDNWACPVGPHFVAQISPFSVDSGAFSIVGRIRDESAVGLMGRYTGVGVRGTVEKKQEAGRVGGAVRKKGGATGGTSNLPGGVTLRTGGATPRAAYAREARRELHDVDNWACPVGPHFVAQISPFSVDSGAFSIVGRIRDESAVGSHGEIYRGWGARNGREKAGSWTGGGAVRKKGGATGGTSNLPGGVTLRTGGATPRAAYAREARRELHDVDNWACPVGPHFVAQISPFSVDSGAFSIVGRIRDESAVGLMGRYTGVGVRGTVEKKQEAGRVGGAVRKKGGATGGTSNLPGGVTLRTGGATPRAAYAREARRELHDVDNWACPVGPHFVAQISPFSVDSGAFSIVGRIRDESAVGSHGEIYRGWGARNGREKAGSWTGGRSSSQKGVQHEDFPGGHPSYGATGGTSNLPGGVTLRTGGATPRAAYAREARRELHDVDNWACPVGPHFVAQISPFSVDSGAFSIVGRIRDESAVGSHGEIYRGWGARNGREKAGSWTGGRSSSQKGVQHEDFPGGHPSYGATGGTSNLPGGVTLRTGGATPRAAYAREARRELHDVDNWACPVGPHFVAQISPFSVDSGAFSIVGRIRDESAVGSHGEIYRGWGARNGREKAGSWTGGRSSSQKGYYSRPSTLNFGVLMGSGALVLRSDRWDVESSGGVTLRTGGATPRAAYAREARRELHDVDNWACPVGPHFVAQISPFSVDSGAFSIVGRIRDESAVGSQGEIYRGWGARNGREKAGS
ncbi:UNVERIFIED_CONTAM: hypothetical protein Sindi_2920900 [Sesamum indicum]